MYSLQANFSQGEITWTPLFGFSLVVGLEMWPKDTFSHEITLTYYFHTYVHAHICAKLEGNDKRPQKTNQSYYSHYVLSPYV